jgi:predicted CXXCH cytochrome family protein
MRVYKMKRKFSPALLSGLLVGILAMFLFTGLVYASPPAQGETPPSGELADEDCRECHLDVADDWSTSPHAHAYDDPVFQQQWIGLGSPDNCLACHTTNFISSSGEYDAEGVSCKACHGTATTNHPPEIVPTKADADYCGTCHTTTLSEWRKTGHGTSDVGCMDCHNPHNQDALFENPDDLCINCHREGMGDYLNDLHVQKDIGCVDCHALVIPPEVPPEDGIVPTGHSFSISPQTCVACHTDALHAGFTLPGYENGAAQANGDQTDDQESGEEVDGAKPLDHPEDESEISSVQQIQALETALASSRVSNLFQGAVIGLVLGGSTAWIVGQNIRQRSEEEETDDL